jgi:hypothetical protein
MGVGRRREAGQRHEQLLVVAADRDGQILQFPGPELLADLGAVGLQNGALGRDGDVLLELTDAQGGLDARDAVERDGHVIAGEGLKPCHPHDDVVGPCLQVREPVGAGPVADGLAGGLRLLVRDGHRRAREDTARRIPDRADDRPIQDLGLDSRRKRAHNEHDEHDEHGTT